MNQLSLPFMETRKMKPQTKLVLNHLNTFQHITPVEAAAVYKVRSLPKRISELKSMGYPIKTSLHKDATGQRYAKYSIGTH